MLGFSAGGLLLGAMAQKIEPVVVDVVPWLFTLAGLFGFSLITRIDQQAVGLANQDHVIRQTEVLMHHVVQNSFDAIVTVGQDGVIETFNRAAQKLFGMKEATAVGKKLSELVRPAGGENNDSLFAKATEAPVQAVGRSRAGRRFPVELVVTAIDTAAEPKLVAVLRDITERNAHQEELKHQATHDPLTDLPNRSLLRERVAVALESAQDDRHTVAVLLLDLDRFKEINDALGHRTGDLLLIEVSRRLREPLAPPDTLARLGGDEFAVLLPATTLEKVLQTAWKLIESLRSPFEVEELSLQVDTSLGITLYPDHGHDAETLIPRADVAMYVAKRKRAGLAVYRPEQDFNHMRLLTLRGDLRTAIEDGQLTLAYQPKISATSDRIMGVEALVRWKHPEHGNIPPDEFIGLAEHSGLIGPLTQFVLRTAMRQAAEWRRDGLQLNVSGNLSARNLLEEGLPKTVERLLSAHEMLPEFLTLEITESVIMEDPERALKVVTRLEALGASISVDDFGTGYSSLGYLMQLPATELKIDKSFVMQMEEDVGSATIVRSTIELAHNLGLKVVAEGVESEAIWESLKKLGCDIGQGFLFSRPVTAERLPLTIRNLEARNAPRIDPVPQADELAGVGAEAPRGR
jgi:diguanylate cyclase (GGDEF)-like protein/PAS domain S-box-containing protein